MSAIQVDGLPGQDEIHAFLTSVVDLDRSGPAAPLSSVADDLAALGTPPGTPVLIALPNGTPLLACFFAVLLTGGVPVLVPPSAGAARIEAIGRRFGAGALIAPRVDPQRYGAAARHRAGDGEAIIAPWPQRRRHAPGEVILMTSGTSGIFSGCLHGIGSLLRNAALHARAIGQRAGDTVLLNLPLHYSYGLVAQALAALVTGSRLVVCGPPFTPVAYAATLREQGVTLSSLTPALVVRLAGTVAWSRPLRVLTVGGDHLGPQHVGRVLAAHPGLELYLTYGLTEAGPRVSTLAAHLEPPHRHASVGLPLPGVTTALRPAPLGDGSRELLVRSDTVLRRRVPDDRPDPLVASRTIATGDLFEIDGDGYHYYRGRLSDSLVVNDEKVWLPSVRELAAAIPGVLRATTRVYRNDDEPRYDLDLYVDRPDPAQAAEIERTLRRLLLRAERPSRIVLHPISDAGWHK
ncbi:long-chain fatty acid--CoA ligase [Spongiactinospora rosea]|uniref:Long-chain fatty acid--CoA ligase n=1 Tax=Spongiactinospora rosea TaxID=2248750 RepID=A0A366LN90_9ACTN|nr:class I adenylate-forming enzyme family protein [Spongiactinospora rosea]RBQ15297.1 long-chain fatty acid--CoA ligase [Spongiactinospora rosea]